MSGGHGRLFGTLHVHESNPEGSERLRKDLHHAEGKTVAAHQPLEVPPRQGQAFALFSHPCSGEPWSIVQESHLPEHIPGPPHRQFLFSSPGNVFYDFDSSLRHNVELGVLIPLLEQPITRTCSNSPDNLGQRPKLVGR